MNPTTARTIIPGSRNNNHENTAPPPNSRKNQVNTQDECPGDFLHFFPSALNSLCITMLCLVQLSRDVVEQLHF